MQSLRFQFIFILVILDGAMSMQQMDKKEIMGPATAIRTWPELCQTDNMWEFEIYGKHKQSIKWHVESMFYTSKVLLGKGGFGEVREVDLPLNELKEKGHLKSPVKVAIKKFHTDDKQPIEVQILRDLSDAGIGIPFYGCYSMEEDEEAYIVQESYGYSLNDKKISEYLLLLPPRLRWKIYLSLLRQIVTLNILGYVHNDIKPGNILINMSGDDAKLIDFGAAQLSGSPLVKEGTVFYFSFRKCSVKNEEESKIRVGLIDDLWSFLVTLMVLEDPNIIVRTAYDEVLVPGPCRVRCSEECYKYMDEIIKSFIDKSLLPVQLNEAEPRVESTNLMGLFTLLLKKKLPFEASQILTIIDRSLEEVNKIFKADLTLKPEFIPPPRREPSEESEEDQMSGSRSQDEELKVYGNSSDDFIQFVSDSGEKKAADSKSFAKDGPEGPSSEQHLI